MNDLESGTSAWIYWNMILDENGGPWLVSPEHRDPDGNQQHPVVIIDRKKKEVTYTGLYYYLAHFSKFVRPGAVRVETGGSIGGEFGGGTYQKVRCIAFKGRDGGMVAEVLNSGKQPTAVVLHWQSKFLNLNLPALSITTCLWNKSDSI
jgi:glucosylceramidase